MPPSRFRSVVPVSVDGIVLRILCKNTAKCYQTWGNLAGYLVEALCGLRVQVQYAMPDAEKLDTVHRLDFFRAFSDVELWEVLLLAKWQRLAAAKTLIQEADIGSSFFILAKVGVEVRKQKNYSAYLNRRACFGEMAYLGKHKFQRSASVLARSDVVVIGIRA